MQGRRQQIWAPQLRPCLGPLGYILPIPFLPTTWKHPHHPFVLLKPTYDPLIKWKIFYISPYPYSL